MSDLKHPMQKGMQARINFLLSRIEEAGREGVEQRELETVFLVNGFGSPPLVRKYLSHLADFGKIRKEGSRYFSKNFPEMGDSRQAKMDERAGATIHDTHTHTQQTQPDNSDVSGRGVTT